MVDWVIFRQASGIISCTPRKHVRRDMAHARRGRMKPWRRRLDGFPLTADEWARLNDDERHEIESHGIWHGYTNMVEIVRDYQDERLYGRPRHPLLQSHRCPRGYRVKSEIIEIDEDYGGEVERYEPGPSGPEHSGEFMKIAFMVMLILGGILAIQFMHLLGDGIANFPKELAMMLGLGVFAIGAMFLSSIWRGR